MGVTLPEAENALTIATKELFQNPTTRSVGIGVHGSGYGFHVIRNIAQIVSLSAVAGRSMALPQMVQNVPVSIFDRRADILPHVKLPFAGPGSPGIASLVPEQQKHNPLGCGLQIENFDDDVRTGTIAGGHITIGSLGCFVVLPPNGDIAILSNNHVVAGENRGVNGADRIMQPGSGVFTPADQAAILTNYVQVVPTAPGVTPATGAVNFNVVDAGVAKLQAGVAWNQDYLSVRKVPAPAGVAVAAIGDEVYKVGRTTGLTFGVVTSISAVVGPIPYALGPCWFQGSITIEGINGTMFSDHGDSGAAVIKQTTGQVIGLLYAGNGTDTFACPIDAVLRAFNCSIV
jgi:hypothetical protein